MRPFEWYYFDLHSHNGYDVVFTIHTETFSSVFEVSIWDLFVYYRDQLIAHHFIPFPKKQLRIQPDPFTISADEQNYYRQLSSQYVVHFRKEKLELLLEFARPKPRQEGVEFNIYPGQDEIFTWKIFSPKTQATGFLTLKGQKIELAGTGYHDYNRGNFNLKDALSSWMWGKLYAGDQLFILGLIKDRKGHSKQLCFRTGGANEAMIAAKGKWRLAEQKIILNLEDRKKTFLIETTTPIDEIYFLTASEKASLWWTKVRELATYVASLDRITFPLYKMLANARYARKKLRGRAQDGEPFTLFMEEMWFDK